MDDTYNNLILREDILKMLHEQEELSTCAAKKVGCIIINENLDRNPRNIIYKGYNRSVSPCQCNSIFKKKYNKWYYKDGNEWRYDSTGKKHKEWSIKHEVHAEIMALTAFRGTDVKEDDVISATVTYSPCLDCCKSLIDAGVKYIWYLHEFDNIEDITELCLECGVELEKIEE